MARGDGDIVIETKTTSVGGVGVVTCAGEREMERRDSRKNVSERCREERGRKRMCVSVYV